MRTEVVRVRLSPEERETLKTICGDGRTASEVIRSLFRDYAGLPVPVGPVEAATLSRTNDELRRIGISLSEAVRAMNENRIGFEPGLDAALHDLVDGLVRLRLDVDRILRVSRVSERRS